MAGLITTTQLRTEFPFVIQTDISPAQLSRSLASASKRLKSWIGETVYEETNSLADDDEQKLILQNAEGHLALHYALLGLNTNLRSFGLVKSENVEGNTVIQYFSPTEIENFTSQYLELAQEIAAPFMETQSSGIAPVFVEDAEINCSGFVSS